MGQFSSYHYLQEISIWWWIILRDKTMIFYAGVTVTNIMHLYYYWTIYISYNRSHYISYKWSFPYQTLLTVFWKKKKSLSYWETTKLNIVIHEDFHWLKVLFLNVPKCWNSRKILSYQHWDFSLWNNNVFFF